MSVIDLEAAVEFYEMKDDLIDLICRMVRDIGRLKGENAELIKQIESIGKKENE